MVLPDRPESLFRLTDLVPGLASVLRVEDDVRSVIVPVVVATPHRGAAAAREVDEVLAQRHIPTSKTRWIGWDPKAADAVRGGAARAQRSVLLRTARAVVESLVGEQRTVIEQRASRARLATEQFSDAASQWRGMGSAPTGGYAPPRSDVRTQERPAAPPPVRPQTSEDLRRAIFEPVNGNGRGPVKDHG